MIDEILATPEGPSLDRGWWIVHASLVLTARGRSDEVLAVAPPDLPTRWVDAARAWAQGDVAGAADTFARIGSAPDEAYAHLTAAERLLDEGRRHDAEPHLARALELYRAMGAATFLRRAEGLLATPA